jgi:DNA helicase INO80
MNEEDMRLVSSDLEDCQEIWLSEVSDYILETRKRHREVEAFYKLTVIVREFIIDLVVVSYNRLTL